MVDAGELFKDVQVLLDAYKIVKTIKKPLVFVIDGTTYYVDLDKCKAGEGKPEKAAELTLTVGGADIEALRTGKLDPVAAFMQGRVKIKGNMGVLMRLQGLQPKLQKLQSKY